MKIIKGRFKYNFEDALKHKIAKTRLGVDKVKPKGWFKYF